VLYFHDSGSVGKKVFCFEEIAFAGFSKEGVCLTLQRGGRACVMDLTVLEAIEMGGLLIRAAKRHAKIMEMAQSIQGSQKFIDDSGPHKNHAKGMPVVRNLLPNAA
jgi:hypothetical protein